MNAKEKFNHWINVWVGNWPDATSPAIAMAGYLEYDQLFSEVSTSVADFMSCEQSQVSLELQRKRVAHFYYRGILVIRSCGTQEGFHFA